MSKYSLKIIYKDFEETSNKLCEIVKSLASLQPDLKRDVHIEGCFIKFVVKWEIFIEEYFLRCMCSATTHSGGIIKPKGTLFKNTNKAFIRLNKDRKGREIDYTDWLSHDLLKQRCLDFFHHKSRVHQIYDTPDQLYALVTIRNAIAHGSVSSFIKFRKLVVNRHGYLSNVNPSIADLLVTRARSTSELIFIDHVKYFKKLAYVLTS